MTIETKIPSSNNIDLPTTCSKCGSKMFLKKRILSSGETTQILICRTCRHYETL